MTTLSEMVIQRYVNSLVLDGERIMQECERERTYKHDTRNLYDSYAFGVYVNRKIVKRGYLSPSAQAVVKRKWYGEEIAGREEIDRFLDSYGASDGLELVVVAAMPYAQVLEKRGYRVIAMAYSKMQILTSKYGGAQVRYISRGIRQ